MFHASSEQLSQQNYKVPGGRGLDQVLFAAHNESFGGVTITTSTQHVVVHFFDHIDHHVLHLC